MKVEVIAESFSLNVIRLNRVNLFTLVEIYILILFFLVNLSPNLPQIIRGVNSVIEVITARLELSPAICRLNTTKKPDRRNKQRI
jgi:hypothetical protein